MTWQEFVKKHDRKILDECRAGIIVGVRVDLSSDSTRAEAVRQWTLSEGIVLWVVDDLMGLAPKQPFFVGVPVLEVFGLEDDHREGVTLSELERRISLARARMGELMPRIAELAPVASTLGAWFVWSGPLCGGLLVKGVFRDTFDAADLWFESDAECVVYQACRGASQAPAPGGVFGVAFCNVDYDSSAEPIEVTPALLASADSKLAASGLLTDARIFTLPRYD